MLQCGRAHTRGTRVLAKRDLGRPLLGLQFVLGDSENDLGNEGEFSFECYQKFSDWIFW